MGFAVSKMENWVSDLALAMLAGIASFGLYIRTLAPGLLFGDSGELQTLSYTLGMTHPTGYPIYLLLGKCFTFLPFRDIAYRVNLLSAYAAALTVGLSYEIGRILGMKRLAALSGALTLACTPLFWQHAVIAELYDVGAAFLAAILLLTIFGRRRQEPLYWFLAGLLGGLSLGVHNTVALAAPGILLYLLFTTRKRQAWLAASSGAVTGLALTLMAFLALDWLDAPSSYYNSVVRPSLSTWGLTESDFDAPLERLKFIFGARQFRGFFFDIPLEIAGERLREFLRSFSWFIQALAVWGGISLFYRRRENRTRIWQEGVLLSLTFGLCLGFAMTYNVGDYRVFTLPAILVATLWLGLGIDSLMSLSERGFNRLPKIIARVSPLTSAIIGLVLLGVCLSSAFEDLQNAWQNGVAPSTDGKSPAQRAQAPGLAHLQAELVVNKIEDDAIVFTDWWLLYPLYYVAHIEQGRTGIAFHETQPQEGVSRLADLAKAYIRANIDRRPIYFTQRIPELSREFRFQPVRRGLFRLVRQ